MEVKANNTVFRCGRSRPVLPSNCIGSSLGEVRIGSEYLGNEAAACNSLPVACYRCTELALPLALARLMRIVPQPTEVGFINIIDSVASPPF
jgi:hypothetical protein